MLLCNAEAILKPNVNAILLGNTKVTEITLTPMNDHQENLRDEAAKAFNESLKKLEELWEETTEDPPEAILEELAAAAADIEEFFQGETNAETTIIEVPAKMGLITEERKS